MTPSSSTQSCATYTWFMMNASSPITVGCFQPWWICAYSRITLPSPIRAPAPAVLFPPRGWANDRTSGGAPMTTPAPIQLSSPIVTGP